MSRHVHVEVVLARPAERLARPSLQAAQVDALLTKQVQRRSGKSFADHRHDLHVGVQLAASEKYDAVPPSTSSTWPNGVSSVSSPSDPTTSTVNGCILRARLWAPRSTDDRTRSDALHAAAAAGIMGISFR